MATTADRTPDITESAAGLHSVKQLISHEPSFTRKRRTVQSSESEIVRDGVLIQSEKGTKTKKESSSVPLHKVVGSHITPLSTEYQVQYTWKSGPQTDTPLLSAEKLINGERSQKEEGRSEGGGPEGLINGWRSQGQEGKGGTEELINREKSQGQEGDGGAERLSPRKRKGKHKLMNMEFTKEKGRKEKGKTRTRDRTNVEGGKVKDDGVKTTETTVKHPSKTVSLTNGQLPPSSPPPNDKTRHRSKQKVIVPKDSQSPSKSPQRELNGHPIAKRGSHGVRGKKSLLLGQSEYRTQFKAWPIPSNTGGDRGLYGWRKQQRIHSPKKRSDITDPQLASLSPPPNPILGPLSSGLWETEYSTRFKSPLDFQYVRGAWMETPRPTPTPKLQHVGRSNDETCNHNTTLRPCNGTPSDRPPISDNNNDDPHSPEDIILAQLSEIRQRAAEYRQRSEECHFTSVHSSWRPNDPIKKKTLNNAHPQSQSSSRSSSVSLMSDDDEPTNQNAAQPHTMHNEHPSHRHTSHTHTHTITNGKTDIMDVESEEEEEREKRHDHQLTSNGQLMSNRDASSSALPQELVEEREGRVPTPVLQESPQNMRHHLDRTTPTSGAVLTSPHVIPSSIKSTRGVTTGTVKGRGKGVSSRELDNHKLGSSLPNRTKNSEAKEMESGKTRLHLSRGSTKLKQAPSLLSSVTGAHSRTTSSLHHTQSKGTNSSSARPQLSTHRTLTSSHQKHRLSSPLSTISSLLSSDPASSTGVTRGLNQRSTSTKGPPTNTTRGLNQPQISTATRGLNLPSANRGLNYSNRTVPGYSKTWQPHNVTTHPPHVSGCRSPQCDICGAWLRKSHTGAQAMGLSQHPVSHTHHYKGPVTQLNHQPSRGGVSHSSEDSTVDIPEGLCSRGANYSRPQSQGLKACDELSISSLSLSSCSVASDLLKKARQRRERFWTQPPNPSHSTL